MSFAEDNGHDLPFEDFFIERDSVEYILAPRRDTEYLEYVHVPVWYDQHENVHTLDSMSTEYIKRCIAKIKRENWRTSYLPLFYKILKRRYNEKVKL